MSKALIYCHEKSLARAGMLVSVINAARLSENDAIELSGTMSSNIVEIEHVYKILVGWAKEQQIASYLQLSRSYSEATGKWLEPHGSWDFPLGEINRALAKLNAPALSALVVLQETNEPGHGFWGCAPNVPKKPKDSVIAVEVWNGIVKQVFGFRWPERFPA